MGAAWRYWTHIRLEASGHLKKQEVTVIKAFFQQQFPEWIEAEAPDLLLQTKLVEMMRSTSGAGEGAVQSIRLAEGCLRCFVSNQIPQVCLSLEQRFGTQGHFTAAELLPYVLDDVNPLKLWDDQASQPSTEAEELKIDAINSRSHAEPPDANRSRYRPLAIKIVHTFDPGASNLSTWTKRLVSQQKDLNKALNDCGIYLASNWSILNHTTPARLARLLAGDLTEEEIRQVCQLLESFHVVYRGDRTRPQSAQSGRRCSEPDQEQLQRMGLYLKNQGMSGYTPTRVLQELRVLAQRLRGRKKLEAVSLDDENTGFLADQQQVQVSEEDQQQDAFLLRYQQESKECLQKAIQQAIDTRLAYLRSKKPAKDSRKLPKDQAFLKALRLFYCEGKSMSQIAPLVGLEKQFQVTRLLELDTLRTDVRLEWLLLMVDQLDVILQDYLDAEQLKQLQQQLQRELRTDIRQKWLVLMGNHPNVLLKDCLNQGRFLLGELIDRILAEDATDAYGKRNYGRKQAPTGEKETASPPLQPKTKSMFAACICQYLNILET